MMQFAAKKTTAKVPDRQFPDDSDQINQLSRADPRFELCQTVPASWLTP
jgi:hypothetical protein